VGLFNLDAICFTGAMEVVPLPELTSTDDESPSLSDVTSLKNILPRRPHDFHKGDAGRVGIVAGSRGMLGAVVLCALGAMRSGAGLITVFVDEDIYQMLSPMLPPEVMLRVVRSLDDLQAFALDSLAIGPGIGVLNTRENKEWVDSLTHDPFLDIPIVLDADALNRIAEVGGKGCLRSNHVVTPHPGEMARLFPEGEGMGRFEKSRAFTDRYPGTTLLLKGVHSVVTQSGESLYINGSGHAGMACGGQGDVLTGVIAGLLAQGVSSLDAARLGAWLCGRAAELAVSHGNRSIQSLSAGDIPEWLGLAFAEL